MSDDKPGLTPWQKEALEHYDQTSEEMRATVVAAGGWCAPSTIPLPVSRESLLWGGHVEPTEEERQAAADELYADEVRDNRAWFDTGVFLERVKAALPESGLALAVLMLHRVTPVGPGGEDVHCGECSDEHEVQWPCATARLALAELDVEVPERLVYVKPEPVVQDPDNPRWPFPAGPVDPFLTIPLLRVNPGGIRFDGETINLPTDG